MQTITTTNQLQFQTNNNNSMKSPATISLIDLYNDAVSRLSGEEIYSKYQHDFNSDHNGKMRGKPPFRESNSGSSFTVYSDKGFFDAGDGFAGSPADYIHSLSSGRWENAKGRDFFNAVKILCEQAGVTLPERELSQDEIEKAQKWERRRVLLNHVVEFNHGVLQSSLGDIARDYLNSRNINNDAINELKIGYCHKSSDLFNYLKSKGFSTDEINVTGVCDKKLDKYISFPWWDSTGKILTIYYRYSAKKPPEPKEDEEKIPKTHALPGVETKSHPYLFNSVVKNNHRECIFAEGLFDVIALQLNGETRACSGVAASFSGGRNKEGQITGQIKQLKRHRIERVYHIGDPDEGGDAGTESNLKRLLDAGIEVFIPERLPDGLDPDEFIIRDGIDALKKRVEDAEHGLSWMAKRLISKYSNSDSDKIKLIKEAKKWIQSIKNLDPVIVEMYYFSVIAKHLGIPIDAFKNNLSEDQGETSPSENETIEFPATEITQAAFQFLYGDKPWISVNGILYEWMGTHYTKREDVTERKRIANYLNKYCVGKKFPYAKPGFISMVLDWAKSLLGLHPDEINPSALNCTNGILKINWVAIAPNLHPIPKYELIPHSPDFYFLYEPIVTFDQKADPSHCNKMLEALDPEQQDIFLKTIGASLDLATVRRFKGRSIKALLCKGHGSNGKDTLREAVAALYGYHGMTGAGLDDFAQYDSGRKFPLAKLIYSRVNWASENGNAASLDKIQSLKAAITGDTLSHERKGENESEFNPQAILLFNINDVPRLGASLEAIKSRFAVLSFDRTYKVGADPSKGEIEADSRLKYDPEWVKENILPAFLNKVLQGLTDLMVNGIDYNCTERALDEIRCQNGHLWQFASDTGLTYNPDETLSAQELWEVLEAWYLNNGTLTHEEDNKGKVKNIWEEPMNKSDKLIKTKNHVIAGFLKIFPKASRVVMDSKNGKTGIKGLCFTLPGNSPGNLRVTCGYPDGYQNPYTEGVPGKSGNFSELRAQEKNIDISPAITSAIADEMEDDIAKTYPTYPEPLQDKEKVTLQDTQNIPGELPGELPLPSDYQPDNKATGFDGLDVGDVLIAEFAELHLITARRGQQWLTHRGEYVSRTALQNQDFKVPTIGEMVTAIQKIIVHKNSAMAHLLKVTYENDPNSLFCQAIATDEKLKEIYNL